MNSYCIRLFLESDEAEANRSAASLMCNFSNHGNCSLLHVRRYWKIDAYMEIVICVEDSSSSLLEVGRELGVSWTLVKEGEVIWNSEGSAASSVVPSLRWAHGEDLNYY